MIFTVIRRSAGALFAAVVVAVILRGSVAAQRKATSPKFPPELVQFTPYAKNPIFESAGKGHWDEVIRERGWIVREGNLWKMWYTGYRRGPNRRLKLGYATSADGIHWKRYAKNPLYGKHWVEDMMVVKHRGKYLMFAEGLKDRAQLLMSGDGIKWKRVGQLDVRLTSGKPIPPGPYGTPTVWRENGVWNLFYERRDLGVWLAKSKDLKVWTNVQDEPVMVPGPGQYDKDLIAWNQVIKYKGRYYVYYHGSARSGPNKGKWCTCVATSTDLLHWEKYPRNPIQPIAQNKSSGILVQDGKRFRLYTMHPAVQLHFSKELK